MRPNVTDQWSSIIVGKPIRVKEELQLSGSQATRSRDRCVGLRLRKSSSARPRPRLGLLDDGRSRPNPALATPRWDTFNRGRWSTFRPAFDTAQRHRLRLLATQCCDGVGHPGQRGRYDVAGQFTRRRPGGDPERPSTDPCEAPYECRRVALARKALSWPVPAGGRRGHCVSVFGLHVLVVGKQRGCRWSVPQVLAPRAVSVPRVLGPKVGDELGLDQHSSPQLTSCHDRTRGKRPLDELLVDGIEGWEVGHCR